MLRHYSVLISHSREINQLASVTSVGVEAHDRQYGGVQEQHGGSCFTSIQGRCYHHDVYAPGNHRPHPLLGNGLSYVFLESTWVNTPASQRFSSDVINAALELRQTLRRFNPIVRSIIRDEQLHQRCMEFMRNVPEAEVHVEDDGLNVSSTASSQLMLLFSLQGNLTQVPNTTRDVVIPGIAPFKVKHESADYERTAYPLIDIYGDDGWYRRDHDGDSYKDCEGNVLTLRKYIRFKYCQSQVLRYVPRLAQEWLLDMVSRSEYLNQREQIHIIDGYRKATVNEVLRSQNPISSGKACTLPSSIRGTPAYRRLKVDEGMAHVFRFGPPTFFITFTANPEWPEVLQNLPPGQKWFHNPLIVNMVFQLKLRALLKDMKDGTIFGTPAVYYQYTIEFQKRGLPHAHILVRISGPQPTTPGAVDQYVSARLPVECSQRCGHCRPCTLHALVTRHMIHKCFAGRCFKRHHQGNHQGGNNQQTSTRECRYGFPKPPVAVTEASEDGRWVLRRSPQDSDVVAYNEHLLLKYRAHINVEVASSSRCVLYLRKYLTKGPDNIQALLLPVGTPQDQQFDHFYKCRTLCASEAAWIALEYDFNGCYPATQALSFHLPGEDPVWFDPTNSTNVSVVEKAQRNTHNNELHKYFDRPPEYEDQTFEQFFSENRIERGRVLARLQPIVAFIRNVNYLNRQHYSAYVLIRKFPCRSFLDLRGGYPSFEHRAIAEGLFGADQTEFHISVCRDICTRSLGHQPIVQYIAMIVIQREFEVFQRLFEEFWRECIMYRQQYTPVSALANIEAQLNKEGCSLHDVAGNLSEEMFQLLDDDALDPTNAAFEPFFTAHIPETTLNDSQSIAVQRILDGIHAGQRCFFLNGCAGAGKTYVVKHLITKLRSIGFRVLSSAYSGIAASLIPGAVTAHRLFGLPTDDEQFSSTIGENTFAYKLLKRATAFIIDECSMLNSKYLEAIDLLLQKSTGDSRPFGNRLIILTGDFRQCAPIVRGGQLADVIDASIARSQLFQHFSVHSLDVAVRFDCPFWASFLLDVAQGKGELLPDYGHTAVSIPPQFAVPHVRYTTATDSSALQYCATHHESVWVWNTRTLHTFYRNDDIVSLRAHYSYEGQSTSRHYFPDVEQGSFPNIPHHELDLAIGCPVMILRNILVSEGLVNGKLATVTGLGHGTVQISFDGKEHSLPRINFTIKRSTGITIVRHQFPLQLAFGATISKLQGQTITNPLAVDLTSPCFAHGQLYVALSRTKSPKQLTVVTPTLQLQNVVYQAILPAL